MNHYSWPKATRCWRVRQPERARRRCGLRALMGGRTRQLHTRTLERPPDTHKHPSFAHVSFPYCSRIVPMSRPTPGLRSTIPINVPITHGSAGSAERHVRGHLEAAISWAKVRHLPRTRRRWDTRVRARRARRYECPSLWSRHPWHTPL